MGLKFHKVLYSFVISSYTAQLLASLPIPEVVMYLAPFLRSSLNSCGISPVFKLTIKNGDCIYNVKCSLIIITNSHQCFPANFILNTANFHFCCVSFLEYPIINFPTGRSRRCRRKVRTRNVRRA